jgi:hypothetical protein
MRLPEVDAGLGCGGADEADEITIHRYSAVA